MGACDVTRFHASTPTGATAAASRWALRCREGGPSELPSVFLCHGCQLLPRTQPLLQVGRTLVTSHVVSSTPPSSSEKPITISTYRTRGQRPEKDTRLRSGRAGRQTQGCCTSKFVLFTLSYTVVSFSRSY